jgi:hypothetical protein
LPPKKQYMKHWMKLKKIYWPWFIKACSGKTIIGFYNISSCQILIQNMFSSFLVKRNGDVSFWICVFSKFQSFQHHIHEYISIHSPPVCFQLNLNWIES